MGMRMYNVRLTPRGRTTSIVSPDGEHWFTNDGKPVDLENVYFDNAGADFLGAVVFAALLAAVSYVVCWLLGCS